MIDPWYLAWWALNWEMWDDDSDEDLRPTERRVFSHIQRQAQVALIIRYAIEYGREVAA